MPVLATYFSVRRGRDPFFKFYMKTLFPRQVREYEREVRHQVHRLVQRRPRLGLRQRDPVRPAGYGDLDEMEEDEGIQAIAHRAAEWILERHHTMFLRERMGPELKFHL